MNHWITQAVIFGFAVSGAAAAPDVNEILAHVSQCANANIDPTSSCLVSKTNDFFENGPSENGPSRRRFLEECSPPPIDEQMLRMIMNGSKQQCTDSGFAISDEEFESTVGEYLTVFGADSCWLAFCEENPSILGDDDDDYTVMNYTVTNNESGMNFLGIAFEYVLQCAELNFDTGSVGKKCMTENAFNIFMHGPQSRRRFLQDSSGANNCTPPGTNEQDLVYILYMSKEMCLNSGVPVSDLDYSDSLDELLEFWGSDSCWIALCEESLNPSAMFLKLLYQEVAQCAKADLDFDSCLVEEAFGLLFSEHIADDDDFGGVSQRKVRRALGETGDTTPCEEPLSAFELDFKLNLLLAEAEEKCKESDKVSEAGKVDMLKIEFKKLFSANHCMGIEVCGDSDGQGEINASFLEFVEQSTVGMMAQCAGVDEASCVFHMSMETLHGMKHLDMCNPPDVDGYVIEQIVMHVTEYCTATGAPVEEKHVVDAKDALMDLVAKPQCWEDICSQEAKDVIVGVWMDVCASIDMIFLLPGTSSNQLENDKLRCMMEYILSKETPADSSLECSMLHLDQDVCDKDIVHDSYLFCSDDVNAPTAPPSKMQFSMSFAYDSYDEYDWAQQYDPGMSFSYAFGNVDDFSMSFNHHGGGSSGDEHPDMHEYIEEVCGLIDDLKSDVGQKCLRPICEIGVEGAFGDNYDDDSNYANMITFPPTESSTTTSPSITPTTTTPLPTMKPTTKPTSQPTSSTPAELGSVDVSFEVAIKLEGIDVSDLDFMALEPVVKVLEKAFVSMLPEGARVRLLKVGGVAVSRRVLRYLEDSIATSGVDVEFEVTMTKQCDSAKCEDSAEIANALYDEVTADLKTKVEDGSVSSAIQKEADDEGVSQLKNVTVNSSSLKVGAAKVTVTEGTKNETPEVPKDDDDNASVMQGHGVTLSIMVVVVSMLSFLSL